MSSSTGACAWRAVGGALATASRAHCHRAAAHARHARLARLCVRIARACPPTFALSPAAPAAAVATTAATAPVVATEQGAEQPAAAAPTSVTRPRDPLEAPVRKLTVDLIKTYKHINKVGLRASE